MSDVYDRLVAACGRGSRTAAVRIVASYQPIGGLTAKVFPPTYPGQGYLLEERFVDGTLHGVVALDAVQSQANRLEEALLDAVEAGEISLPYIEVAAQVDGGAFRVTSLDAPHRSPDAYFRDAQTADGVAFDKSPVGQRLRAADDRHARAFFEHSPTDLVLGMWDSQRGGRGLRLPRAYSSEILALDPVVGKRGAGRLDPYNMQGGEVFYDKDDPSNWSFDPKRLSGGAKATKGKPSNVNHGNALASEAPGGVAVTSITRTAVLSLAVLQRLRFPTDDGVDGPATDVAARAVLAALALLGDRLAFSHAGLFLRSGCDLVMTGERLEWVNGGADPEPFELDADGARGLFERAVAGAAGRGLRFAGEVVRLEPAPNLRELIELNLSRPAPADAG
jgi:CRISPR-associated protein Csb1